MNVISQELNSYCEHLSGIQALVYIDDIDLVYLRLSNKISKGLDLVLMCLRIISSQVLLFVLLV